MSLVVRFAPTGLTKAKYDSTTREDRGSRGSGRRTDSTTTSASALTAISRSARFGTRRRNWTIRRAADADPVGGRHRDDRPARSLRGPQPHPTVDLRLGNGERPLPARSLGHRDWRPHDLKNPPARLGECSGMSPRRSARFGSYAHGCRWNERSCVPPSRDRGGPSRRASRYGSAVRMRPLWRLLQRVRKHATQRFGSCESGPAVVTEWSAGVPRRARRWFQGRHFVGPMNTQRPNSASGGTSPAGHSRRPAYHQRSEVPACRAIDGPSTLRPPWHPDTFGLGLLPNHVRPTVSECSCLPGGGRQIEG